MFKDLKTLKFSV